MFSQVEEHHVAVAEISGSQRKAIKLKTPQGPDSQKFLSQT